MLCEDSLPETFQAKLVIKNRIQLDRDVSADTGILHQRSLEDNQLH
jgi:hypothetical protein